MNPPSASAILVAAALLLWAGPSRAADPVPRIAGLTTVYRPLSHAQMLLGRLTETDTLDGAGKSPDLRLVAVHADQVPDDDLSRGLAGAGKFRLAGNVAEALTLGGPDLGVDGVLLVAEHGEYPESDTGQFQYPKRRMFAEMFDVFDRAGRGVPVFCDKHLADNWADAKWIHDEAVRRRIPLMAGSSLPVLWRRPAVDVPREAKLKEIVAVSYGRLDAYGFHALEMVQCLAERRSGGETGIRRVRTVTGDAVWASDLYDRDLFEAALARQSRQDHVRRKPLPEIVKEPVLFAIEYVDGLRASVLTLNGAIAEWTVAWEEAGGKTESTRFEVQEEMPYFHFAVLMDEIEVMMHTGEPPWPVKRTLLTTGVLDAALVAKRDGIDGWLDTPHLAAVKYRSTWTWKQPLPPPTSRTP